MTDKKIQTKIASLEKKIEAKQNSLEVARERRRMSGKSKGVQSEREIKLSAEISNLRQELHVLKSQAKESVNEATVQYTGRETKDGVWRVFQNGKAVAVAGPFKSREEASAWISQHSGDKVDETSDYMRRRQREEDIISGKRPARKKAPAQTSDYAKRRAQEKKQGVSESADRKPTEKSDPRGIKFKVTADQYGSNREVPLYTKTYTVYANSEKEAIDNVKSLVGGRNHRIEQNVKEAKGLKKRVRLVKTGQTGTIGEVRHGMYKGAPKEFTVDLDDGGSVRATAKELRLIKDQLVQDMPQTNANFRAADLPPSHPQGLSEGKVKELSMDLKDKSMSDAEFKKKYGKTREEMRKSFNLNTEKKKKVSESVVQTRRLEELNEKAEKLADLYEKVKQRRDFETMSKIKSAMGRVAKKRNEIKESLGITESEDTPNPAYDYKFWDEMTPSEKIRSHTLGQGITVWNPQTRKYAVKFPVPKGQVAPAPNSLSEDSNITADQLDIGDEVIITGNVQFQGSTGVIDDFGRDKAFVVVNLYNHGKHSFHSSDVSFNDYAGSEEEDADWRERDGVYESMLEEALDTYKKLAGIKTSK